jgi:tocopherol cyclase
MCFISMLSQVTLPGEGQSFAWMYSIEDPAGDSKFRGCGAQVSNCASKLVLVLILLLQFCHAYADRRHCQHRVQWLQVMGPDKAYLVQHTDNTRIFWADRHELVLGACFKGKTGAVPRQLLDGVSTLWHPIPCLL